MLIQLKTKYIDQPAIIYAAKYINGNTALMAVSPEGEDLLKLTANLDTQNLPREKVIIKSYSENEGVFQCLIEQGVIATCGYMVNSGYVQLPVCTLTARAIRLLFPEGDIEEEEEEVRKENRPRG